jgi:hypothetical protein
MPDDSPQPFLAAQRRDVLGRLASEYTQGVGATVFKRIADCLDPEQTKIDGKGGALDGTLTDATDNEAMAIGPPICGAYPGPPPKAPKESKEVKDGGKDAKDSKEGGKDHKDSKEHKDTSDGDEENDGYDSDPFIVLGDPAELPIDSFEAVARTHPERVEIAVARGSLF